jgi:K+-sensing histidine kinase KdpD
MMRNYQRLLNYGVAIGSTAIALLLSLWLEPLISRTIGAFFYIAIIVTTWYGGFRPGMVAVILSTLTIDYLFILPQSQFSLNQPEKLLRVSIFLMVALVINLLTSNLQHSKQKIKFSPTDSTITLSVQQQTDRVLFKIADQGRGIPVDKLEAVFGRFQQVDASDSRTKGGTGLGLAICRSIIDQHGGQIWAESTISALLLLSSD